MKPLALVVDDNKITTKLLNRYLTPAGYNVKEAYDGIECLEKVQEEIPDAIVLDVMMPRLDGYETVKRLKADPRTARIPVVIVTALNDVSNQVKAIESGADDFLSKPIEDKLLIAKVKLLSSLSVEQRRVHALTELLKRALDGGVSKEEAQSKLEALDVTL
jgi:two-component system, cell cycle response regulator